MSGNFALLVLVVVLVPILTATQPKQRNAVVIDNREYYSDNSENRNYSQALAFCIAEGGELAKVNGRNFRRLRRNLPTVGSYWIDGVFKVDAQSFQSDSTCTSDKVDLTGVPPENFALASSCLSLVNSRFSRGSIIQITNCNTQLRGVVCAEPLSGCDVSTTAPTSTSTPSTTTVAAG